MDPSTSCHDAYLRWITGWFNSRTAIPDNFDPVTGNYFEAGLIDSFAVIELVEAVESQFGIRFTEANFQYRRFTSILGLAEIIDSLIT